MHLQCLWVHRRKCVDESVSMQLISPKNKTILVKPGAPRMQPSSSRFRSYLDTCRSAKHCMRLSSIILWAGISTRTLARNASTMTMDAAKTNVLHQPLQPLTSGGDSTHPTGFFRDGYCWGSEMDPGQHYIGAVVSKEFLEFSKSKGNDLTTPGGQFPGLKDGCKWCLCVNRWKEAFMASASMGEGVVPKVDLSATALDALKSVRLEDLKRFEWKNRDRTEL